MPRSSTSTPQPSRRNRHSVNAAPVTPLTEGTPPVSGVSVAANSVAGKGLAAAKEMIQKSVKKNTKQGYAKTQWIKDNPIYEDDAIAKKVNELSQQIKEFETGTKRRFEELQNTMREELPKLLKTDLLESFSINGSVPVTMEAMKVVVDSRISQMEARLLQCYSMPQPSVAENTSEANNSQLGHLFDTWSWGGRIQMVPEGFSMPECSVKALWDLWHFGHRERRIQPYKFLRGWNLSTNNDRSELSKGRAVIQAMYHCAISMGIVHNTTLPDMSEWVSSLSTGESDALFDRAYAKLVSDIYPNRSNLRIGELRFNTLYNKLPTYN